MIRVLKLAGLAMVLSLLAGCAIDPAMKPWWTLKDESFVPIKPGLSKAEVEKLLGKPLGEMKFPRLKEDLWGYRFLHGTTYIYIADVYFDEHGLVKYYTQYPDPNIYEPLL